VDPAPGGCLDFLTGAALVLVIVIGLLAFAG
jgi:hypothetical protein